MTFDNADELHKIAALHPEAEMLLRIITDDSHSLCKFSVKVKEIKFVISNTCLVWCSNGRSSRTVKVKKTTYCNTSNTIQACCRFACESCGSKLSRG